LRRAPRDLDLRPDLYTHYYRNEFPERFHPLVDTRRWGPGERLMFEPYTKEAHTKAADWITCHGIFAEKLASGIAATRIRCCRWRQRSKFGKRLTRDPKISLHRSSPRLRTLRNC
jgi:hypothetical protein